MMKSQASLKMCNVGSKTRSLGHIEKPCVRSRSLIFRQKTKKLGQNFCLDEISDQIFNLIVMKLGQIFFDSLKSCTFLKMGHFG